VLQSLQFNETWRSRENGFSPAGADVISGEAERVVEDFDALARWTEALAGALCGLVLALRRAGAEDGSTPDVLQACFRAQDRAEALLALSALAETANRGVGA